MWDWLDFHGWLNYALHTVSITSIIGAIAGLFPPLAALVGIIYYSLAILRDPTVQTWLRNKRKRKLAKYEEEIKILREKISGGPTSSQ